MANPAVVQAIIAASKRTGADPVALLATSLQESGGRYNAVGDQGTSFGPFQYHRGGALGTHTSQWAMSNAEIDAEAQRFAANEIHHGVGAAALQRPADPTGYAAGVDSHVSQARQLLAQYGGASPPGTMPTRRPASPNAPLTGGVGVSGLQQAATQRTALLQSIIDQNAQLAGIPTTTVPTPSLPPQTMTMAPPQTTPRVQPQTGMPAAGRGIYQHANFAGHDQGIDYRGAGPVTALADAVVTRVQANSGWPGAGGKGTGTIVVYRVTRGPYRGRHVYVAENITPRVRVGQTLRAGQPIATAHGAYPYTESGWADPTGRAVGTLGTSNAGRDFAKAWGLT